MTLDEKLLYELKQAVLDNLKNDQFSVAQLSKIVGVSRSHLHRKLKKLKGQSISQFIRELRLEEARKLLQQDVSTTSEIAYEVGFGSPSYFHKCFHDYFGYPPSEAKNIFNNRQNNQDIKSETNLGLKKANNQNLRIYKFVSITMVLLLVGYWSYNNFKKEAGSSSIEKSIAVLPFKSLSDDESNQHFADGLVDDLLNRLATINEFKVISRTSSDTYSKEVTKKVPVIASELGVSYILEGSVRKYDNKVRITVQLIDAKRDDHLWIKTFDRDLADVFKLQSEIAFQIASDLRTVLTEQQTSDIQKKYTENIKAFELYQLGRFYWGKRLKKDYETAINYFNQSIDEDPDYALAYAGLGDTYFLKIWYTEDSTEIRMNRDKAEKFALKALELDPRLVEAHTVLVTLYFFIDWDWEKAEKVFLHALDLKTNYSTLHHRYSEYLSYVGRHNEARYHINKAIELDPLSFIVRQVSAKLYLNRGKFHEALAESKIAEDLNKEATSPITYQFWTHFMLDNYKEALKNLKKFNRFSEYHVQDSVLDSIYEASGRDRNGLIRCGIESFKDHDIITAEYYAFLGENDKAMDILEAIFNEGNRMPDLPYWYSPNALHSNPRYITLMTKMNLPYKPNSTQ